MHDIKLHKEIARAKTHKGHDAQDDDDDEFTQSGQNNNVIIESCERPSVVSQRLHHLFAQYEYTICCK
jgi:hypothetical protein